MTPATLLQFWRDRWHKPPHPDERVALVHGKFSVWSMNLARSEHWNIPGLPLAAWLVASGWFLVATTTPLTDNAQIVLGWSLIAFAIYLRRHRGQVVALALVGMAAVLAMRYFLWRADQTLPSYWSASLALGLVLLLAEFHAFARSALHYLVKVWPLSQGPAELPADAVLWPTVDLWLLPSKCDAESLTSGLSACTHLNWPANKLRVTVLDYRANDEVAALCTAAGIELRTYPRAAQELGWAGLVNHALHESSADLIMLLDCQSAPTNDFLRDTVGWLIQDPHLGLLHGAGLQIASGGSDTLRETLGLEAGAANWMLARRTTLLDIGGLPLNPECNLHDALREARQTAAVVGTTSPSDGEGQSEWVRLDTPWRTWRLRIRQLADFVDFYYPATLAVFYTTPVLVLLFGVRPLHATWGELMAYWLPFWVLGRLALATSLEHYRLRWIDFVAQELSAIAVLFRTTWSYAQTLVSQLHHRRRTRHQTHRNAPPVVPLTPAPLVWTAIGVLVLVIFVSLLRTASSASAAEPLYWLYVAWASHLALLGVATLAVQREVDWTRWAYAGNTRRKAMVRWKSGELRRGWVTNFPTSPLLVELTGANSLTASGEAFLSLFIGYREYVFPVHWTSTGTNSGQLSPHATIAHEFSQFVAAAYSRPADWPLWLPGPAADQLLPSRLQRLLHVAQDAFYNLAVKSALTTTWQRVRARLSPGSKTHG